MLRIRFQNKEWLFVGDSLDEGGAIATELAYARGECSYAHLSVDGVIRRFRKEIGTQEDIEVIGPVEDQEDLDQVKRMVNIWRHPSWDGD